MDKLKEIQELLKLNGVVISDDELQTTIVELQYLIEIWLDSVEKQIFEGKTLEELLSSTDI